MFLGRNICHFQVQVQVRAYNVRNTEFMLARCNRHIVDTPPVEWISVGVRSFNCESRDNTEYSVGRGKLERPLLVGFPEGWC